jgi:hypothetical protein
MDSVALSVKMILKGSFTWKRVESVSLASYKILAASIERRCPDRPGLAPISSINLTIVSLTSGGFGQEVAALSR